MTALVTEVTVHAIAIATLTTLAILFRGPIQNATRAVIVVARGLSRNVSGEWYATLYADGETYEQTIRLRQFADFIWGTIESPTTGRTFRMTGRIVHHTLIARYELTDGSEITSDNGTFSLRLNDEGDTMQGYLACSAGRTGHNSTCEYVWRRTLEATDRTTVTNQTTTPTTLTHREEAMVTA